MRVLDAYDDLNPSDGQSDGQGYSGNAETSAPRAPSGDDASTKPLFLVYTPHVAHCPLQVCRQ